MLLVASLTMLLLQSCGIDAESIAQKAIRQAEKESAETFVEVADYGEEIPTGDLPRLNYARNEAGSRAAKTIKKRLNMDDETKVYTSEQQVRLSELVESAYGEIDKYYDPLIIKELQSIEGNQMPCFYEDGISDVEATIEHVEGTRHIRVRLEGTMTKKGKYLHYRRYSVLPEMSSTGAATLFNMDKSVNRILNMPGDRVYCYIILDLVTEQATTAIEITRINY